MTKRSHGEAFPINFYQQLVAAGITVAPSIFREIERLQVELNIGQMLGLGGNGSKTGTEECSPNNKMESLHSGVTTVNIHVPATLKPNKNKTGSFKTRESFSPIILQIVEGKQSYASICRVGDMANFLCTPAALGSASVYYSPFNYYQLNPDSRASGSDLYPVKNDHANVRINLDHAEIGITLRNLSTLVCIYVDIYVLEAKKNVEKVSAPVQDTYGQRNATDVWVGALVGQAEGLASATGAVFGSEEVNIVGGRPQDAQGFKDMYHIKSVHHLNLDSGAEETVNYDCPLHMSINGQKLLQDNCYGGAFTTQTIGDYSNVNQCRIGSLGHGLEFMIVAHSGLIKNTTTNVTSYGSGELGIIVQRKLKLSAPKLKTSQLKIAVSQNALETGATLAQQGAPNVVDGIDIVKNT